MRKRIEMRPLTPEEREQINKLMRSQTAARRQVERARVIWLAHERKRPEEIAVLVGRSRAASYRQLARFNQMGLTSLDDLPRPGRPRIYTQEVRGQIIALVRADPQKMGKPYGHWTLHRLQEDIRTELDIGISIAQLARILKAEGLRWYQEKTYFTERPDPQFAEKRGRS